jgi:hypothetical protein
MNGSVSKSPKPASFLTPAGILLGLIVALPRILRMASPLIQIEDPNYIYGAFLMLRGFQPFHDFAQPNPPFLESVLSVFYSVFGVNGRIPEAMSACAYCLTAIVIYRLARRLYSPLAGTLASLLFSFHFLPFRYHLFEREIFATLAVAFSLNIILDRQNSAASDILAGALVGLGYACKQTALISFLPIAFVLVFIQRRFARAAQFTAGFMLFALAVTGIYSIAYGNAYLRQTFWFHLIKGAVGPWWIKAFWTLCGLGFLAPFILASIPLIKWRRDHPHWILLALTAADLLFFWFVSGAFWPHYLLSTLLPASILSGAAIASWFQRRPPGKSSDSSSLPARIVSFSAACIGAVALLVSNPSILLGAGAVQKYGFDGIPRREVEDCAAFIRQNTNPDEMIVADPYLALLSERILVVRFEDNWGLVLWMNDLMDKGKYQDGLKSLSASSFGDVRLSSHRYWLPELEKALKEHRIGAIQYSYEVPINPQQLDHLGFKKSYVQPHYEIWLRTGG